MEDLCVSVEKYLVWTSLGKKDLFCLTVSENSVRGCTAPFLRSLWLWEHGSPGVASLDGRQKVERRTQHLDLSLLFCTFLARGWYHPHSEMVLIGQFSSEKNLKDTYRQDASWIS